MKSMIQAAALCAAMFTALQAQADVVTVGAALPLTGNVATWAGGPVQNGILLATDEVNQRKEAGSHTLKVLTEDMASDRTQGITLSSRFINTDKVSVIVGLPTSVFATAVAPMANEAKTPMLAIAVSKAVPAAGPWSYKLLQAPEVPATALAEMVVGKLKPKNIVIVYNRDNDAFVEQAKSARAKIKDAKIPIVADEGVLITDTNFTALASKIVSLNPDVLLLSGVAESMANVVVQARQAGMKDSVQIVGMAGLAAPAYARIGGKAIDGTIFTGNYFVNAPQEVNTAFVGNYKKRFGTEPDEFAAEGYTMIKVLAAAVKTAGADRDKLRQGLDSISALPVVMGKGTFTIDKKTREPSYGTMLLQWKNGSILAYQ